MSYVLEILFLSCVFIAVNSVPIATLDPISNNGIRNIPKNSCHVNGEIFEDGDQVIMTRADLNGEMDPCESCLCVRGEVFCWWGGCPPRHTLPPPTPRPLSGHPSSISPPSSTSAPPDVPAGGGFPDRPTLSPPPLPGDDPTSAKSSSVETSTPEYPEDEEEEGGESSALGLGHEGVKSQAESGREGKGDVESFLGPFTTKPNAGGSQEGGKQVEDDFGADMGVEGLEKNPPEGMSELADTVSETGDLEKQSRQQQSPSLDMFDVDAF
ncbi:uncharacterized protein [Hetaerina americana]|uniref:uncharacterized protein n=1 Tax=Hetaerina americana TaxID=62018 RepID=UPI003A7F5011